MQGLFVTGTDTGVGKTWITCFIAAELRRSGLRMGTYKPVCSGAEYSADLRDWTWPDVDALHAAVGDDLSRNIICPQRFYAPLAPPVAAKQEGRQVDSKLLRTGAHAWEDRADVLLVEGIGGWKSPLTETETVADLATDLGYPVLIVSPQRLGTISHTLLVMESVRAHGLRCAGVVMNELSPKRDGSESTNPDEIQRFGDVPVWGVMPFGGTGELRRNGSPVTVNWLSLVKTQ